MMLKEEEKAKVNCSQIKSLEKILDKIDLQEQVLIDEFDLNVENILGKDLIDKLLGAKTMDNNGKQIKQFPKITSRVIRTSKGKIEAPYSGILQSVHKSLIDDSSLRSEYEKRLSAWFSDKTTALKSVLYDKNIVEEVNKYVPEAYALASLALTTFHKLPDMKLRDVQKLAAVAISNGDIAELGTGEGKTLAAILPVFLHGLRGKGAHVITANSYLSKRDFEEVSPIFNGLGLTVGFVPENIEDLARIEGYSGNNIPYDKRIEFEKKLQKTKKNAYKSDITYGSKSAIAFDYLRDGNARRAEDLIQREENPGFALVDEVDDALVDDAQSPYILGDYLSTYINDMTLMDLANSLNVSYEELSRKVASSGIPIKRYEKLSYEKARHIAKNIYAKEIIPDQFQYQKRAQRFCELQSHRVYDVEEGSKYLENNFNIIISPDELYEMLTEDSKEASLPGNPEREALINEYLKHQKEKNLVIVDSSKNKYEVNPKLYDEFFKYCYFAFQINSVVESNERSIVQDHTYVEGRDYNFVNGKLSLTPGGQQRIIHDNNHPEFLKDYEDFFAGVHKNSIGLNHYLQQALKANFGMRGAEDKYKVDENGVGKVVKHGRYQDGSSYSDGLQQALELASGVSREKMTAENHTIATVTQKNFYSRYDLFSGMTGTSAKSIFREIFNKETISVPKNAFYQFFSTRAKRKGKNSSVEPVGLEKRDVKFSTDLDSKIMMIADSIRRSQASTPKQPVLVVASDPKEVELIANYLSNIGIKNSVLSVDTDKSKEAEIIAKAGLPGAVTISQEMAGRGTDIKLGGDRNTIIDIATERYVKKMEEKQKKALAPNDFDRENTRRFVEKSLMDYRTPNGGRILWSDAEEKAKREILGQVGLKVVSSGYFEIERIDKQLEGRTGRNGMSGVCERFSSISDLKKLGMTDKDLSKYLTDAVVESDGSITFDKDSLKKIKAKVKEFQSNNEGQIQSNIMWTQELSKNSTDLTERYRAERRKIISGDIDLDLKVQALFEDTIDNLLMSYVVEGDINQDTLIADLSENAITIDLETFSLDAKAVLGVNIDLESVIQNGANILELRSALLDYVQTAHAEIKDKDPIGQTERDIEALLIANSYAISNIPDILERSLMQKNMASLALGMEGQVDHLSKMEFHRAYQSMRLEASKIATQQLVGIPLSMEEQKELDDRKDKIFAISYEMDDSDKAYEEKESISMENNGELVATFRTIKSPIEERSSRQIAKADEKAEKLRRKGKDPERSNLYSNIDIKPMRFISAILDSEDSPVLVSGKPKSNSQNQSKGTFIR